MATNLLLHVVNLKKVANIHIFNIASNNKLQTLNIFYFSEKKRERDECRNKLLEGIQFIAGFNMVNIRLINNVGTFNFSSNFLCFIYYLNT